MTHPNKTFVLDFISETNVLGFNMKRKHVVIVVADSKETAAQYLKQSIGYEGSGAELVWLMGCNHPTIYDQTGKPLEVQAKIVYNTSPLIGN